MRRRLLFLIVLIFGKYSAAAEFAGYVALTTDYVKRGVSQSDSDPALQLGADVSFTNGFYLGVWASTTDYRLSFPIRPISITRVCPRPTSTCTPNGRSMQVGSLNRVTPGNPDNSYLIQKLEGTAAGGSRMPQGGPFLDQATVDMIRQWITDGALDN